MLASTTSTYTFAASGQSSTGGSTFTTDSSSAGPGNTQNWSGTNYFGSNYTYWTGRTGGTGTAWGANGGRGSCGSGTNWNSATATPTGTYGIANATSTNRWFSADDNSCATSRNLVCMVNPGNESSQTAGYFVLTATTWNGNLGGRSGADAKCLTELSTTHTDWRGYSTANANGQLVASKVKAFLCDTAACTNLMANQTYNFAKAGDSSAGGASFTTDSSSYGPSDSSNWSGTSYFSGTYEWWSNRYFASGTQWNNSAAGTASGNTCNSFVSSAGTSSSTVGNVTNTDSKRWNSSSRTCDQSMNLICFVNP